MNFLGFTNETLQLLDRGYSIHNCFNVAHLIYRNIPALVLIIFWDFAIPNLFSADLRRWLFFDNAIIASLSQGTGISIPYYAGASILGLALNTSAYLAELFRAGVGTIAQAHIDAAQTLGATQFDIFKRILLPQGLRAAFPAISTRLIHNMKNTALASLATSSGL